MDKQEAFVKRIGEAYYKAFGKDEIDENKFKLDPEKTRKAAEVFDYCEHFAKRNGGTVECCVTKKKNQPAEVALRFVDDLIIGDEPNSLEEFTHILTLCDGINISGTGLEDGSFLISFFIENLYVPKN